MSEAYARSGKHYERRKQLRLAVGAAPKPYQIETRTQAFLVRWANGQRLPPAPDLEPGATYGSYLFAIPNGGRRERIEAKILKGQGVKAGVWDLFFPVARLGAHGLWLETKANHNKLTDGQAEWGPRMDRAGYETVVFYDWPDAMDALKAYVANDRATFEAVKDRACKPLSKR